VEILFEFSSGNLKRLERIARPLGNAISLKAIKIKLRFDIKRRKPSGLQAQKV
jgi:hypothetical protein